MRQALLTILPYILIASIGGLGWAWAQILAQRIRKMQKSGLKTEEYLRGELTRLGARLESFHQKVNAVEQAPAPEHEAQAGLSTTLRSKVLKMHRLGQSAEQIAESLGIPKGEVLLLVKVHGVVMEAFG